MAPRTLFAIPTLEDFTSASRATLRSISLPLTPSKLASDARWVIVLEMQLTCRLMQHDSPPKISPDNASLAFSLVRGASLAQRRTNQVSPSVQAGNNIAKR